MSAFDYARAKAVADRLITKFGKAGKVRRPTTSGTAYNPTAGAPDDHDAFFAVFKYQKSEIDGSRILQSDRRVLLAKGDLSIEPSTSDLLVEGNGAVYKIVVVEPLEPADTAVFYEIQARR